MRTIATLNFPDSMSGIWRLAPPLAPVPAHALAAAEPLGAAEPFGAAEPAVPLHAPNVSATIASSDNDLTHDASMEASSSRVRARPLPGRPGVSAAGMTWLI